MTETDLLNLIERHVSCALLHRLQCGILRALDRGDLDTLRRLIASRDALMDRLRLRDEDEQAVAA